MALSFLEQDFPSPLLASASWTLATANVNKGRIINNATSFSTFMIQLAKIAIKSLLLSA